MRRDILTSLIGILIITVIFGVVYPLLVTGSAQLFFSSRADGSKIERGGKLVGSSLIGQDFRVPLLGKNGKPQKDRNGNPILVADRRYFQSRPSTTTQYNAAASSFTNLGPNSKGARDTYANSLKSYLALEQPYMRELTPAGVPVDAVTSSASGVDPHISRANALIQAHRVATTRNLSPTRVRELIDIYTDGRSVGLLGEPGVNVLKLNLALDREGDR